MLGLIRPMRGDCLGEDPAAGEFAARRRLGYLPGERLLQRRPHRRDPGVLRPPEARGPRDRFHSARPCRPRPRRGPPRRDVLRGHAPAPRPGAGAARRTAVLLLDEPTTGMDPALRQSFYGSSRSCAARRDGPARLACPHRAGGTRRPGGDHEPRREGCRRHLDELRRIARPADPDPPEGDGCRARRRPELVGPCWANGARSTGTWSRSMRPGPRSRCCGAPPAKAPVEDLDGASHLDGLYAHFLLRRRARDEKHPDRRP